MRQNEPNCGSLGPKVQEASKAIFPELASYLSFVIDGRPFKSQPKLSWISLLLLLLVLFAIKPQGGIVVYMFGRVFLHDLGILTIFWLQPRLLCKKKIREKQPRTRLIHYFVQHLFNKQFILCLWNNHELFSDETWPGTILQEGWNQFYFLRR